MKPPRGKLAGPSDVSRWGGLSARTGSECLETGKLAPRSADACPTPAGLRRHRRRAVSSAAGVSLRTRPIAARAVAGAEVDRWVTVAPRLPFPSLGSERVVCGAPVPPEGVRRYTGACPTRLETRTKESDARASRRVFH